MCPDHVHMLVEIPPSISVSSFVGYLKGKSTLMIFERHANLKYKYGNRHFWCRGYYVDTAGKDAKKSKGVHREVESEESWRQNSGLTNRNHIRLQLGIRLHDKSKSNNYPELTVVNVADGWSERLRSYLGRSRQQVETEYETCSNNEWREVSRGHSTIVVANMMGRTEL